MVMFKTLIISFGLVGLSASAGIGLDQIHQFGASEPETSFISIGQDEAYVQVAEIVVAQAPMVAPFAAPVMFAAPVVSAPTSEMLPVEQATPVAHSQDTSPLAPRLSPYPRTRPTALFAVAAQTSDTTAPALRVSPNMDVVGRSDVNDGYTSSRASRSLPTLAPRVTTSASPVTNTLLVQPTWVVGVFR